MADDRMRYILEGNFPRDILTCEHAELDQYPGGENIFHNNINAQSLAISRNMVPDVRAECLAPQPFKNTHIRYRSSQWLEKKSDLERLYITMGFSQQEVVDAMAKEGFYPSLSAFKRKCDDWGWGTYQALGARKLPRKPSTRTRKSQKVPATNILSPIAVAPVDDSIASQSSPDTIAAHTPQDLLFLPASIWLPPRISESPHHVVYEFLLRSVKDFYVSHLPKWDVHDPNNVKEDEHDDLLVGIGSGLRSLELPDKSFSHHGIHKAFLTLQKVVGTTESEDCGFFSLPAILLAYLRLRESKQLVLAKYLLWITIKYAKQKFPICHPFVQVLRFLQHFRHFQEIQEKQEWQRYPNLIHLEDLRQDNFEVLRLVIFTAYQTCVDVAKQLGDRNLSYLQLWSDFVVYGDKSTAKNVKDALDDLRQHGDEENLKHDDHTMNLLGMRLYVLQSTMTTEAEATAMDMVRRLDKRVVETGNLEGEMLIMWKDLMHTLGNFHHARQEYSVAIQYLEIPLQKGVEDQRDIFTLKKLEEWYSDLGDLNEVERVHQWRLREEKKQMTFVMVGKLFDENFDDTSSEDAFGSNSEDGGNLSNKEIVVGEVDESLWAVLGNEALEMGISY